MRRTVGLLLISVVLVTSLAGACPAATIRAGVAVSLKEAMTEIAEAYMSKTGDKVELTFGSSGQIMSQIQGGAPIDVFVSAADKQVEDLVAAGLVDRDTRRVIAGNTLALIVPRDAKSAVDSFESLGKATVKRLAIGEPKTVPAGQYAMQLIERLKLTAALDGKIVYGSNVRQVLDYVARGEVTAGVVYATDAKQAGEKVKVVATAPKGSHEPIVYPAVAVKRSREAVAARRFVEHLATDELARKILERHGFTPAGRRP